MRNLILVVTAGLALVGCGSGGGSVVPSGAPATPSARVEETVKLTIPARALQAMKGREYISSATQGVGLSYGPTPFTFPVNTSPTQAYNVSASSSLCVANPDSTRTCTLPVGPSPGLNDFRLSAWNSAPSNGSFAGAKLLSIVTVLSQPVSGGVTNNLSFTLDGVVNSVHITLSPTSLPAAAPGGAAQTTTLSVIAEDASGSVIVGAGSYVDASGNPLTIGVAQAPAIATETLRTTLSATTVTPSANVLTATYSGNSSSGTTFTPTVTGGTIGGGTIAGIFAITVPLSGPIVDRYALATGAFPLGIASGSDGNVWFVEFGLGAIGKVNPSTGVVTPYLLPGGSSDFAASTYPQDIIGGPDGNMWFTENGAGMVGRITPAGVVTTYSTGAANPESIARGSDGNLWFTECPTALGSVSTSGTVGGPYLGATLGSAYSADAITTGPDGNLWFTDANASINKVNPTTPTVVSSYPYSTTGVPEGIASDPAHNEMLYSELSGSFGTVTTSGTVSAPSAAVSGKNLFGIVAGPDGNAWFTDCTDDSIGRVVNGAVTMYPVTALSAPLGITVGPDGNIWFTERGDDKVDRLIY